MSVFLAIFLHPPKIFFTEVAPMYSWYTWCNALEFWMINYFESISTLCHIVQFWPSACVIHRVRIPRMHCDKLSDELKQMWQIKLEILIKKKNHWAYSMVLMHRHLHWLMNILPNIFVCWQRFITLLYVHIAAVRKWNIWQAALKG